MATVRQKKAAKAIVENSKLDNPKSTGEVLKSVGYGTGLQNQPKRVLQSEGVQEELHHLGFTEKNAKNVVSEIMLDPKAENHNRLKASEMVFKVHGTFAPEKKAVLNMSVDTNNKKFQTLADQYENDLQKQLLE